MKVALPLLALLTLSGGTLLAQPADRDLGGVWMLRATVDPGLIGLPMGPEMFNIGASLEGGLPYLPWAAAFVAKQRANARINDPLSHCLPIGPVRSHTITFYREIVQLPDQIIILSEYNVTFRRIYTDGRPAPADAAPKVNGHSTGRWQGDTLLVETTGFIDGAVWLDAFGSPLTDAAKITERFRLVGQDELAIEVTVDDPKAYTKPWTVTLQQQRVPGVVLDESFCAEEQLVDLVSAAGE
jgi:hypothetical protein